MRETTEAIKIRGIPLRRRKSVLPPRQRMSKSSRAWFVWVVSLVFVLFQFFLQLSAGEIIAGLMKTFSLGAAGVGILASSYYFVYVLLQSPAGMLIDRYGPRRLLTGGACVVFIGCVLFATAHTLVMAVIGRLMMGTGAAFAFVGSLNLVSRWFPANRFGLMTALAETFGMLGSIIGTLLLAASIHHVGWRVCMLVAAGVSAILAILLWTVVRDAPDNVTMISARSNSMWWSDVKSLLANKLAWLNGLYAGLLFLVVTVFVALWGESFLQTVYHMSLIQATWTSDMVFIGVAVAGPFVGWLDVRIERRNLLMMICPLLCAGIMAVMIYVPGLSDIDIVLLMLLLGFPLSVYVLSYVIGNEMATPSSRTTSIGFVNTIAVGTAPLFGPFVGCVLGHPMRLSAQQMVSVVLPYKEAFSLFVVGLLIAGVIGYSLPNRPQAASVIEEV